MTEDQEVQDLVEMWRQVLDLEQWDSYREKVRISNSKLGYDSWRRTGTTTRDLLTTIATCHVRNIPSLLVGGRGDSNKLYCHYMAKDLVSGLGFNIRVGLVPLKGLRQLTYLDHWQPGGQP